MYINGRTTRPSNTKWLHTSEFIDYAPEQVGVQVAVNHDSCTAGADRKQRLYVKRVHGGVIAFCQHCGKKGAAFKRTGQAAWDALEGKYVEPDTATDVLRLEKSYDAARWVEAYAPSNTTTLPRAPEHVYKWLASKGVRCMSEANLNWGAPDGEEPGLILPIRKRGYSVVGVQVRRHFGPGKCAGPKYETKLIEPMFDPFIYAVDDGDTVVLVEDYLSAIRLCYYVAALPLYGNSMSDRQLLRLIEYKPKRVVVWLDNDKPEITESAIKLGCRLRPYFDEVLTVTDAKEPTRYSDDELEQRLRDMGLISAA